MSKTGKTFKTQPPKRSRQKENLQRAGEGVRTLDNNIGNVVLCQLSYARKNRPTKNEPLLSVDREHYNKPFQRRKGAILKIGFLFFLTLSTSSRLVESSIVAT